MYLHIQSMLAEYQDYTPRFNPDDFFHCDRCDCIMLKSRCKSRLEDAILRGVRKSMLSADVNCLQCSQGKELTGLWLDLPYKVCSILGCNNKGDGGFGLCDMHYKRRVKGIKSKVCKTCGNDVALADYHKKKSAPDGHQSSCKKCMIKKSSEQWRRNNEKNRG